MTAVPNAPTLDYRPAPISPAPIHNRSLRLATLLTAILTFPLVWMGGLVTSNGAGMSVPDWPNSYGYNMFALPFSMWLGKFAGGAFYEHTHRLLGTLVGVSALTATLIGWGPARTPRARKILGLSSAIAFSLFVISLVVAESLRATGRLSEDQYKYSTHFFSLFVFLGIVTGIAWRCRNRDTNGSRRWAVTAVMIAIVIQGLIGGFRVAEISLLFAKLHGIFGQLVFATAAIVATMCSRWWESAKRLAPSVQFDRFSMLSVVALMLVCMQLVLGAMMRHDPHREVSGGDAAAGMAIPDWPLHYGHILPPISDAQLAAANEYRQWTLHWPATTLDAIWLHACHRLGAYTTLIVILTLAVYGWRFMRGQTKLLSPALHLGVFVLIQVSLGVLTVLLRKPADVATAHQATGSLLVMTAAVLVARVWRLYPLPARNGQRDAALVESTEGSSSAQPA